MAKTKKKMFMKPPPGYVSREELAKRFYPDTDLDKAKRQVLVRAKKLGIENVLVAKREVGKLMAYYSMEDAIKMEVETRQYTWYNPNKNKGPK